MELIFASQNTGKTNEIARLLNGKFDVKNLASFNLEKELDEPFETLEENAVHKAKQVFLLTGIPAFADDTGLEIDALNGRPGVYSARYAGEEKDPQKNMDKILAELKDVNDRKAKFRTVIAFFDGKTEHVFEGIVDGMIGTVKRGEKGFGYDPIFIADGTSKAFAEMEMDEKNRFSHRAKAMEKFLTFLQNSY